MNKIMKLCVIFSLFTIFLPQSAFADTYATQASEKLVSGFANTLTGFVELPKTMINTSQQDGVPYGLTVGFAKGIINSIGRTAVGALDFITFLIPTDHAIHPRYVWDDFSRETTY